MAKLSISLTDARALLGDPNGTIWTDAVLIPFGLLAFREMLKRIELNGIPVLKVQDALTHIVANATAMTLPANFATPIELRERAYGSTDLFIPMTEKAISLEIEPATILRYWWYTGQTINFIGAITDREVKMWYWATLADLVDGTSDLVYLGAELHMGHKIASLAALSVGNDTVGQREMLEAERQLKYTIAANVKAQQSLPTRRKGYRRNRPLFYSH